MGARSGAGSSRIPRARKPGASADRSEVRKLPWQVVGLIVALIIPWVIPVGPLSLSVYRLVLILAIVPCLVRWMTGKAGPIRAADVALASFCVWSVSSLVIVQGPASAIEPAGVVVVETMGPYLLARLYIRSAEDFYRLTRLMLRVVTLLLPFAIVEAVTGAKPLLAAFGAVLPTVDSSIMEQRLGLWRVQGPLEHSILFGTFCGSILAMVHLVLGRTGGAGRRWILTATVAVTSFLSLSAGPIGGLVLQAFLVSWDSILRHVVIRWKILWILLLAVYVFVAAASNRSVVEVYLSYFTFDGQTAYFRLLIWEFGSQSVLNNPLFGIGFNEWDRPSWMPSSIDNFWLVLAVRHGIPASCLMALFFLSALVAVAFKRGLSDRMAAYRTAYLIVVTTFCLVGWTVHFWDATYVLLLFLAGSGMWLLDLKGESTAGAAGKRSTWRHVPPDRSGSTLRDLSGYPESNAGPSPRPA